MDCKRCNGIGFLGVINGDSDQICPDCEGLGYIFGYDITYDAPTSAPETVATVEALSPIAQLRIDLDVYDEAVTSVYPGASKREWMWFDLAQDKMYDQPDEKYHMLLDEIDRLQAQNDLFVKGIHILNGFPSCASGKVLDYDRKVAEQVVLHLGMKMDAESQEYLASVEDEIQETEDKYKESYDERR